MKREAYLFYGEDHFSKEEAIKRLLSKLFPAASPRGEPSGATVLNHDVYDAREDIRDLFSTLDTQPFLSARRIVVIRNIESLHEARKQPFLEYIKSMPGHLTLVLETRSRTLDNQFLKAVSAHAASFFFRKPRGQETSRWVYDRVNREGKAITKPAVDLLLELKGIEDLTTLAGEIEKLTVFTGKKKTIDKDDVALVTGKSAASTAFALAEAVSAKDKSAALSLVRELSVTARRTMPEMIIGTLSWRLRLIWKGKELLSRYRDKNRVLAELRIKAHDRETFLHQAGSMKPEDLKKGLRLLLDADRSIKTSRSKPEFILEELVIRLCG